MKFYHQEFFDLMENPEMFELIQDRSKSIIGDNRNEMKDLLDHIAVLIAEFLDRFFSIVEYV
jgi:hypothetical protein